MWIQVDDDKAEALLALATEGDSLPVRYFQERVRHYRDRPEVEKKFLEVAKEESREGELEVDEDATVSMGADGYGAYVMAWMWISNADAGIKTEEGDDEQTDARTEE